MKDLGKHVSNIISISDDEKIISSLLFKKDRSKVVLTTKLGMIKQTLLSDLEVQRYTKPLTIMKLKENDELVSAVLSGDETVITTYNGYYLRYKTDEVSLLGPKASGIKAINLKDDYVINADQITPDSEYLNVLTNYNTIKRLKLTDLSSLSRAKKGSMLFKKTKSKDYHILFSYVTNSKTINILKSDSQITEIKNSDIPIMDISSVGSNISKYKIDDYKLKNNIISLKEENKEDEQLSFENFINNFKI